ncbi:hypothetical protein QLX08_003019 [Tetragonisca angustula]|uniref:Uncharacterized protein n=1 Tax=Tetragonisca angustula TaxID=166442 RepID=A0AAW1ABB9_9HYME
MLVGLLSETRLESDNRILIRGRETLISERDGGIEGLQDQTDSSRPFCSPVPVNFASARLYDGEESLANRRIELDELVKLFETFFSGRVRVPSLGITTSPTSERMCRTTEWENVRLGALDMG